MRETSESSSPPIREARVIFEADQPGAVLQSDPSTTGKVSPWRFVCEAPCETRVVANQIFRVAGEGYYPSRSFKLLAGRDTVEVRAEMKSSSVAAPRALCIIGGSAILLGNILLAAGNYQFEKGEDWKALSISGLVGMAGGAVLGGAGAVMLLFQTRTKDSKVRLE